MKTSTLALPDNIKVHTREWCHDNRCEDVVLFLHGMESHSAWFDDVADCLFSQGIDVFSYDRPGWGNSHGRRGHIPKPKKPVSQLIHVTTELKRRYKHVHVAGLSWGGLLASYTILMKNDIFSSLILIAPGILPKIALSPWQKLRVASALVIGSRTEIPIPIDVKQFTRRREKLDFIKNDKKRIHSVSPEFCYATLKMRGFVRANFRKLRIPKALLLLAERDSIIDNQKTCRLVEQVRKFKVKTFPDTYHSLVMEDSKGVAREIVKLIKSDVV